MMRNWRKILALLLMLALLLPLAPAAMAEDGEDDARFAGRSWEEIVDEPAIRVCLRMVARTMADPGSRGAGQFDALLSAGKVIVR